MHIKPIYMQSHDVRSLEDPNYILDHVLRPMDNLVLIFPRSETETEGWLRAWCFRIASVSNLKIEYTEEMATTPGEIDQDDTWNNGGYGAITKNDFNGTSERDDYFNIPDEYPFLMYHFSAGIFPEKMRLFHSYNGTPFRSAFPSEELVIGEDNHSYVDYEQSPYEFPTTACEHIITKNIRPKFGFHNNDNLPHRPSLKFLGKIYTAVPYVDKEIATKIIKGNGISRHVIPVFGLRQFTFPVPKEWPAAIELQPEDIAEVY